MFSEISIELDLCLMKLERCQPVVSILQVEFKLLIFCNIFGRKRLIPSIEVRFLFASQNNIFKFYTTLRKERE